MINTIKKLISLLKTHELKSAIVLLIMITIMAFLDMIGIASILPFISVLTVPDLAQTNILLNNLFEISKILGIRNNEEFIFFSRNFSFHTDNYFTYF